MHDVLHNIHGYVMYTLVLFNIISINMYGFIPARNKCMYVAGVLVVCEVVIVGEYWRLLMTYKVADVLVVCDIIGDMCIRKAIDNV